MINTSEHKNEDIVKSGVVDYPIGFPFYFNPDRTPQLRVKIGDEELRFNHNFELSEDKGSVVLRPTEEESWTLEGPEDFSWMSKWDGKDLLIERAVPFVQDSDYQLGRISSEQIERDFDLSVMRDQALDGKIKKLRNDMVDEFVATDSRFDSVQEQKADKAELSNYLPLTGGALLGKVLFDIGGTAGKNTPLISVKTASGEVPLVGAKTDDDGVLRDVAVIPKLQSETFQGQQIYASFIGSSSSPVTRIHAKKIGSGFTSNLLNIPDAPGTIARLEDIPDTYTKTEVDDKFTGIESKIPESASATNQLATKADLANVDLDGYVKKSGDTMTGDLGIVSDTYKTSANISVEGARGRTTIRVSDSEEPGVYSQFELNRSGAFVARTISGTSINYGKVGAPDVPMYNVYTKRLNNGADLIVPTEGGTLARLEDLEGIGGGGDYLPTTGGTVDGDVLFSGSAISFAPNATGLTKARVTWGTGGLEIQTGEFATQRYYLDSTRFYASSGITLGSSAVPWTLAYIEKLNNGADLIIPTEGGTLARLEDLEGIGGGASLPDMTGSAGKFLMTDGATAKWEGYCKINDGQSYGTFVLDPAGKTTDDITTSARVAIVPNGNTGGLSISILGYASGTSAIGIGFAARATGSSSIAIGNSCSATSGQGVALGAQARAQGYGSTALGYFAMANATKAIQLGEGTNDTENTFKVANNNGNFEMMDANGNVPLERLTYVTEQIGDISTALTAILGE